ncbi:hypothetical protein HORIV_56380 [Vreelandella olivaria]|uniref:Glycerate kinase n=1 Tax=Vreelandella olivaria TaxID=390919 RepID=A0ABN5X265_9GAMM|nr:hypothetical protein HORIV_56380 [Halomonas olivaria]
MNVLLCPDSFKDALSAQDAAAAMARVYSAPHLRHMFRFARWLTAAKAAWMR